jgi:alpha-tubulin suppressor-like RCC1 family protein
VSSSNVVTLTLSNLTEENVTTSFNFDPYDINESTNTYVFEETTKIGTVPFTVTLGGETYTNSVTATTEGTAYDYVTLAFANPTLSLTTSNVTISSAKLYKDDVLFHTYGTESNVVLRSDQTGTYQAIVNDVYYSNRVTPDFTTTRSVSAPQLEFDGYNKLTFFKETLIQNNVIVTDTRTGGAWGCHLNIDANYTGEGYQWKLHKDDSSHSLVPDHDFDDDSGHGIYRYLRYTGTEDLGSWTFYNVNTDDSQGSQDTVLKIYSSNGSNEVTNAGIGSTLWVWSWNMSFSGHLTKSIFTPTSTTLGLPDGTTRDLTTQSNVYIYEPGTYTANVQTSETFAYLSNVATIQTVTQPTLVNTIPITAGDFSGYNYQHEATDTTNTYYEYNMSLNSTGSTYFIAYNWTTKKWFDTNPTDANNTFGISATDTAATSRETTENPKVVYVIGTNNGQIVLESQFINPYFTGPSLTFDGFNKLTIENLTQTSSTLKYGSNTYDTNTASNVYVTDAGEYKLEARDANTFVMSNVYVGAVDTQVDYTNLTSMYYGGAVTDVNGVLYTWGHDGYGDSGRGASDRIPTAITTISDPVSNVWRGTPGYTVAAKTSTDKWYMWGRNTYSAVLGNTTNTGNVTAPEDVTAKVTEYFGDQTVSANKIIKMAMGEHHAVALTAGGKVWSWGGESQNWPFGSVGHALPGNGSPNYYECVSVSGTTYLYKRPNKPSDHGSEIKFVADSTTGSGRYTGTWQDASSVFYPNAFQDPSLHPTTSGTPSYTPTHNDTTLYLYNNENHDATCTVDYSTEMPVPFKNTTDGTTELLNIIDIQSLYNGTAALDSSGNVWFWGTNSTMSYTYPTKILDSTSIPDVVGMVTNAKSLYAWKSDGTFYTRGAGNYGQLANGSESDQYTSWQTVTTLQGKTIKKVFGGNENMFVWTDDGVYGVGRGNNYKNGDGSTGNNSVFAKSTTISALSIRDIDFGHATGLVLTTDGRGYMWGEDSSNSMANALSGNQSGAAEATSISALTLSLPLLPTLTFDGYNKLTIDNVDTVETATIKKDGAVFATTTSNTVYIRDTGTYTAEVKGSNVYAIELSKEVGTINNAPDWRETQFQLLYSENPNQNDRFGSVVDIDGDYACIGSGYDDTNAVDKGAVYVFHKSNGVWTYQDILQPDSTSEDFAVLNSSLSIHGDTIAAGAQANDTGGNDFGAVYVFRRNGTSWSKEAKLQTNDVQTSDNFGSGVGIYGDYIVGGAYAEDTGGSRAGSAYIFKRTGTIWEQTAKIQSGDQSEDDKFGLNCKIYGDYVIVGAPEEDIGGSEYGAAYIFKRDALSRPTTNVIVLSPADWGSPAQHFHRNPSLDTTTSSFYELVQGTSWGTGTTTDTGHGIELRLNGTNTELYVNSDNNNLDPITVSIGDGTASSSVTLISGQTCTLYKADGTGYSFTVNSGHLFGEVWSKTETLLASDGASGDFFGQTVDIYDGYAIVGASIKDYNDGTNTGGAYIFKKNVDESWTEQAILISDDPIDNYQFGASVYIKGNYAIVGEPGSTNTGGFMYVFERSGSTWTQIKKFQVTNGQDANFGTSVAISGDTILSGAPYDDVKDVNTGVCYVFSKTPPGSYVTFDNYNKITLKNTNYEDTATVSDPNGSTYNLGTAKTMYVKDTGEYVFKISGTDKYVESNVYVSSVDLAGAPTKPIDFDGYNKLTLIDAGSNVSANVTYFSNTYELGSANVLYINGAGTYDLEMSGSNVFALSSNVVGAISTGVIANPVFTSTTAITTDTNWTSGSGWEITADSTNNSTDRPGWKAFDNTWETSNEQNIWHSAETATSTSSPKWLKIKYPSAYKAIQYSIQIRDLSYPRYPKTWKFQGSNNDSDWTDLDTQTNKTDWAGNNTVMFTFSNSTAYQYYRVYITATDTSDSDGGCCIRELKVYTLATGSQVGNVPLPDYTYPNTITVDSALSGTSIIIANDSHQVSGGKWYTLNHSTYIGNRFIFWDNAIGYWSYFDTQGNRPDSSWDNPGGPPGRFFMETDGDLKLFHGSNGSTIMHIKPNSSSNPWPRISAPSLTFDGYNKLTLENFTTTESDTRTAKLTDPNGSTYALGQTQDAIYIKDQGDYFLEVTNSDQSAVVKTTVGTVTSPPTYQYIGFGGMTDLSGSYTTTNTTIPHLRQLQQTFHREPYPDVDNSPIRLEHLRYRYGK